MHTTGMQKKQGAHPKHICIGQMSVLPKAPRQELEDVVFTEVNARWVHYIDALVITTRVANRNIHRMLVDNGSAVDIVYLDAYKRMGLTESKLSPMTSPLYGSTRDHVIPKGIIKLVVMVR